MADSIEFFEDLFSLEQGQAGAVVFDFNQDVFIYLSGPDNYDFFGGIAGVLNGIVKKIDDNLHDGVVVEGNLFKVVEICGNCKTALLCEGGHHIYHATDAVVNVANLEDVLFAPSLDTGEIEDSGAEIVS